MQLAITIVYCLLLSSSETAKTIASYEQGSDTGSFWISEKDIHPRAVRGEPMCIQGPSDTLTNKFNLNIKL